MDWGFTDDELQFYEDEPEYQELIEDDKNKPPKVQITFKTFEDQENAIKEISKILEKYEGSFYSVSGGEL